MAICDNAITTQQIDRFKLDMSYIRKFSDSSGDTAVTPDGETQLTITGIIGAGQAAIDTIGYNYLDPDTFETGATLTTNSDALRWDSNGEYYRWAGALPKEVPAGSTPASTGGIGENTWRAVGSGSLQESLAGQGENKGVDLVNGAEFNVDALINLLDVPFVDGKFYSNGGFYHETLVGGGRWKAVASEPHANHNGGTVVTLEALQAWKDAAIAAGGVTNQNLIDNLNVLLNWSGTGSGAFVRLDIDKFDPIDFGYTDNTTYDMSSSIQSFIDLHMVDKDLTLASSKYKIDNPVTLNGRNLFAYGSDVVGGAGTSSTGIFHNPGQIAAGGYWEMPGAAIYYPGAFFHRYVKDMEYDGAYLVRSGGICVGSKIENVFGLSVSGIYESLATASANTTLTLNDIYLSYCSGFIKTATALIGHYMNSVIIEFCTGKAFDIAGNYEDVHVDGLWIENGDNTTVDLTLPAGTTQRWRFVKNLHTSFYGGGGVTGLEEWTKPNGTAMYRGGVGNYNASHEGIELVDGSVKSWNKDFLEYTKEDTGGATLGMGKTYSLSAAQGGSSSTWKDVGLYVTGKTGFFTVQVGSSDLQENYLGYVTTDGVCHFMDGTTHNRVRTNAGRFEVFLTTGINYGTGVAGRFLSA